MKKETFTKEIATLELCTTPIKNGCKQYLIFLIIEDYYQ